MLALILKGAIVQTVAEDNSFTVPGGRVSPAYAGWEGGGYTLATIAVADAVPDGKRIVSTSVQTVDGSPKYVHVLEDIPPPPIPDRVTARQFKLQLLASNLIDSVETWIGSQSRAVQIAYANSGTFVRTEPMMEKGFTALGFTSEQVDAFFTAASEL